MRKYRIEGRERVRRKTVYVNDQLIGEASTWAEVYALIRARGIVFLARPGAAEGPSGFYISGALGRSKLAVREGIRGKNQSD